MNEEQTLRPADQNNKSSWSVLLLVVFLGLATLILVAYILFYDKTEDNDVSLETISNLSNASEGSSPEDSIVGWRMPASSVKAYPVVRNGQLYLVDVVNGGVLQDIELPAGTSAYLGLGSSDPNVSNDLLHTAIVRDGNLEIVANETGESKLADSGGDINYVTGWSQDNSKIVYYVSPATVSSSVEIDFPDQVEFRKEARGGFYLFNTQTGDIAQLKPLNNIQGGFIDDSSVLTRVNDNSQESRIAVFDTDTFIADYSALTAPYGFGQGQFVLSPDKSLWAHLESENPTNDSSIVYGEFPGLATNTVVKGQWAENQSPLFSTDSKKISYNKRDGSIRSGVPKATIAIFNIETQDTKVVAEGRPIRWLDSESVLGFSQDEDGQNKDLFVVNINTGEIKTLYSK